MKTKTKQKTEGEKKEEIEFFERSLLKAIKTTKKCVENGIGMSNSLVILKKDFSGEVVSIHNKDYKEIRDLLPHYDMLGYIYVVEWEIINIPKKETKNVISICVCKSDFYKRIDFEIKGDKIISEKVIKGREQEIDALDLWGDFDIEKKVST